MGNLKIDIAVGGRFHADQMAKAYLALGHDVSLYTTYPASRFKTIQKERVRSYLVPELGYRILKQLKQERRGEEYKMLHFGRWLAKTFERQRESDTFLSWSSFALETLKLRRSWERILIRDSSHIEFQMEILTEEYRRLGIPLPSNDFCLKRECEEYQLCDRIIVLSQFAKKTFIDRGIPENKLAIIRLGTDTSLFQPSPQRKIAYPLRACFFGTLSARKGVLHLLEATKEFPTGSLRTFLIGSVEKELVPHLRKYNHAEYLRPMPHQELSLFVREMDIFILPTLEDGFGQVLIQAMASGLVPITTDRCGAGECITNGINGLIVPAGNASALRQALHTLVEDPFRLQKMKDEAAKVGKRTGWETYQKNLGDLIARTEHYQSHPLSSTD